MSRWQALVLGGLSLFALIIQIIAEATELKLWPWWAWLVVFGAAVHMGQFLAWLDVKRERDAMRKYDIAQSVLKRVADYRQELVTMQNDRITTDIEVGAWIERYKQLRNNVVLYLRDNLSPAESSLFETLGLFATYNLQNPEAVNEQHTHWRSRCIRDWLWLDECAKDYGRRKLRPDTDRPAEGALTKLEA
jgi:hypothetical protein